MNAYRIDRDVYSILDWVGDLGGLNEGLAIILSMILGLFNFHNFDHFLVRNLYWKRTNPNDDGD